MPILIYYGVTLVTEPLFILALLVTMLLTYSILDRPTLWKWLALGLVLGLAVLLRMAVIFFVAALIAWLFLRVRQQRWRILIPVAVIVLAVAPFTWQNYQMFDRFLLLEANFGHVFWNGNHPDSLGNFHPYRVFPIPPDVLALDNDVEITNELLRRGIQNILNDPGLFVMLTITRLREFFLFWPTSESDILANLLARLLIWHHVAICRSRTLAEPPPVARSPAHLHFYADAYRHLRCHLDHDPLSGPFGCFLDPVCSSGCSKTIPMDQVAFSPAESHRSSTCAIRRRWTHPIAVDRSQDSTHQPGSSADRLAMAFA
jgi:hypothetical protein